MINIIENLPNTLKVLKIKNNLIQKLQNLPDNIELLSIGNRI